MSARLREPRAAQQRAETDWRNAAQCRDEPPETFFPVGTSGPAIVQVEQAKAVCSRCKVTSECLDWALGHAEFGVFGGMSEEERRAVKRRGGLRVLRTHQQ